MLIQLIIISNIPNNNQHPNRARGDGVKEKSGACCGFVGLVEAPTLAAAATSTPTLATTTTATTTGTTTRTTATINLFTTAASTLPMPSLPSL